MRGENKKCQNCKKDFVIEPDDFGFYEKIKVPPPTFCPECRRIRRWAWRNNMSLYSRVCDMCQKSIVSIYSPESGLTVYCNKCWWSDKWDPKSYGVDYDFFKPFFMQIKDLMQKVPHMAMVNDNGIASLNCEYTQDWWFSKDCYMCFSGWHVQNVMYSFFILKGRDIVDCNIIRSRSENLYECYMTSGCYNLKHTFVSKSCIDSQFLQDCLECKDCFMCSSLRNKKYHYRNKEYSKEEYEKILASYGLDTYEGVERAKKEFDQFILDYPRRYLLMFRTQNSFGEIISDSKNVRNCFVVKGSENCRYGDFGGDASAANKDSYDFTMSGGTSESYEGVVMDQSQKNMFGLLSVKSQEITYTQHCHNGKYLFGCIGLRDSQHCILNKQYSKEEYEKLMPQIIKHMNDLPYTDKKGRVYKFGEFYPIELSPFGYNETYAPELNPLSREEAISEGYNWQDHPQQTKGKETILPENLPQSIKDVPDAIVSEVLKCIECSRNYKITNQEFTFYRKLNIPLPRKCMYCRYKERLSRSRVFKLYHRTCDCKIGTHFHGAGKCKVEFETSYAPSRPEIVYCEKCYQKEVY